MIKEEHIMGMPILIDVQDAIVKENDIDDIFGYFHDVDKRFSTYKKDSEISKINRGEIEEKDFSKEMKEVFRLSEKTKKETEGYFEIRKENTIDPSGLVKGWSIYNAAKQLEEKGYKEFYIDAGGDIQAVGKDWRIGIRNPFIPEEIVKVITIRDKGVATSGIYNRGQHIYNPYNKETPITEIVSLTVIGPNVYEADRFATAAFAMGKKGILFIERLSGLEGYMIDAQGNATLTSSFERYVTNN
jgi:thiamine biosynthesis lipoprotein